MRDPSDEAAATIAFHLWLKPEIYGVLRGARGLFGWNRQRRQALLAVVDLRREVLSMRHAVKERKAGLANGNALTANPWIAPEDVSSMSTEPRIGRSEEGSHSDVAADNSHSLVLATRPVMTSVEDRPELNMVVSAPSAAVETDDEEAAKLIEMADAAKTTLTAAAMRADAPTRKAELTRIGEAFAKTRGLLTDEDRRENTLSGPPRSKRTRAKKQAESISG